jgi:FAD/FMN-containing dehydrogenase
MTKRRRRLFLGFLVTAVIVLIISGKPAWHVANALWRDADTRLPLPTGYVDDASRMNATHVAEVWPVPEDDAAALNQLRELLARATRDRLRVSIAGARHTQGGHTIAPDGIVIDALTMRSMRLSEDHRILHVEAGATWADVLAYLDPLGLSVGVMQSNNSFSVGGSISANCHGWTFGKPPIASTVESFRIMTADGRVRRCSRDRNRELFGLALGGYGLFGVILDVDLRVVPNERYRLRQFVVPVTDAQATFAREIEGREDVAMAYARLSVAPRAFLREAIVNVLVRDPAADGTLPALNRPGSVQLRRSLFRGSAASEYGKQLRWAAETRLQPWLSAEHFSRNQLLNEGVEALQNRAGDSTDILHEYFVPRGRVADFVGRVGTIVPDHDVDLLNVTIRSIETDEDTYLHYADQPVFSLVMLFEQATSAAADAQMEALTRELIDAALAVGGRYYLPYRLHASLEQFQQAYPMGREFFDLKRKYDPQELFQNEFYLRYGEPRR